MVGILFSYWGGLFSGAMFVSGRVPARWFSRRDRPHIYISPTWSFYFTFENLSQQSHPKTRSPKELPAGWILLEHVRNMRKLLCSIDLSGKLTLTKITRNIFISFLRAAVLCEFSIIFRWIFMNKPESTHQKLTKTWILVEIGGG